MITIVIDTREQTPWAFPRELAHSAVGTLKTGDYALAGDGEFAIERKSLDDFVGTISSGWERFRREIDRMKCFQVKVIIVEGRLLQCCFHEREQALEAPEHNHWKVSPQFILKQVAIMTMAGVSVLFADTVDVATGLAYAILKERSEQLNGTDSAKNQG